MTDFSQNNQVIIEYYELFAYFEESGLALNLISKFFPAFLPPFTFRQLHFHTLFYSESHHSILMNY